VCARARLHWLLFFELSVELQLEEAVSARNIDKLRFLLFQARIPTPHNTTPNPY